MTRRVVIIGAGPAGLAAAVCLQHHGISYAVLERGAGPAEALRKIDPEMEILSPTRLSLLPGMRRQPEDPPYLTFPAYAPSPEQCAHGQARRMGSHSYSVTFPSSQVTSNLRSSGTSRQSLGR